MPAKVLRWKFRSGNETWTVPQNPSSMTSPFGNRNVTAKFSTGGQVLLTEGAVQPAAWSFEGTVRSKEHYEELRRWVYDVKERVIITDHFGREILCVLLGFEATPKRSNNVYWHHQYKVNALVLYVGPPTVGEAPGA